MPNARRVAAAVGLAAILAGCGENGSATTAAGSSTTGPGPTATAGAPTTRPGAAAAPVPETLRFTATGLDGTQVVGADYAGRDVALWFWAPW